MVWQSDGLTVWQSEKLLVWYQKSPFLSVWPTGDLKISENFWYQFFSVCQIFSDPFRSFQIFSDLQNFCQVADGWVLGLHFHLTHSLLHFQPHLSWFQHCVCPYVLEVFVQLLKLFELPKCCLAASISKFGSFFSCGASWRFMVCFQLYMHRFQCLVWPCSHSTHLHASHVCHLNTMSRIPSTQIVCVHTMVSALFDVFGGSISSLEWLPYHSTHPFHFQDCPCCLRSLTHYARVLALLLACSGIEI